MEQGKWCYSYYTEDNSQFYNWDACIQIVSDTIINDTRYASAKAGNRFNYFNTVDTYIFREENHRVYIWNQEESTEHLIYDFNLNVQDTFVSNYFWSSNGNDATMIVRSIDTLIGIDGVPRKEYYLDSDPYSGEYYSTFWLEGIGDAIWPFFDPNYFGGTSLSGGYNFLCFSDSLGISFLADSVSEVDCLNASPVGNIIHNIDIKIFPNPAQQSIKISSPDYLIKEVRLYNLQGVAIFSTSVNGNEAEIELSTNIKAGVYFCEIITKQNQRNFQKIIVFD